LARLNLDIIIERQGSFWCNISTFKASSNYTKVSSVSKHWLHR